MARADLICALIKSGLEKDEFAIRRTAEAICAEERTIHHDVLANKISNILNSSKPRTINEKVVPSIISSNGNVNQLFVEKIPTKRLEQLVLNDDVLKTCRDLVEEQTRCDLLRSYGLEPRNKVLLMGPPGNGKTSIAEAIAELMMVPLLTIRYESIIGAYLGETASRLSQLFEYVKTRQCVLFFDEFDTIGKERGDHQETGEIKRVVSSLLLQIDSLPSYVVTVAATNHDDLLDKAVWRRFQIKIELPLPSKSNLEHWFAIFEKSHGFSFGVESSTLAKKLYGKSFAEAEEFALSVYRRYILNGQPPKSRDITIEQLRLYGYNTDNR